MSAPAAIQEAARAIRSLRDDSIVVRLPPEACDQAALSHLCGLAVKRRVRFGIQLDGVRREPADGAWEHLYVNAVDCEIRSTTELAGWQSIPGLLAMRRWASLTLSGHCDGAHLNLGDFRKHGGDLYVCGALPAGEAYADGTPVPGGCNATRCKKITKPTRSRISFNGLAANVLSLLGCNSMSLAGQIYASDNSLALAAWLAGGFANIIGVLGSFPSRCGLEQKFARLIRAGCPLGQVVNRINADPALAQYGSTLVLIGDPDYRAVDVAAPLPRLGGYAGPAASSHRLASAEPARPGAGRSAPEPQTRLGGLRATRDFAALALSDAQDEALLPEESRERVHAAIDRLDELMEAAERGSEVVGELLSAARSLEIYSIYYGHAMRPPGARRAVSHQRCQYCAGVVFDWLEPGRHYAEQWCVVCGHLSAGSDLPDLRCRLTRRSERAINLEFSSSTPLGFFDVLLYDECSGEALAEAAGRTTMGRWQGSAELLRAPSPDTVTIHVLRQCASLSSYRTHIACVGGRRGVTPLEFCWRPGPGAASRSRGQPTLPAAAGLMA